MFVRSNPSAGRSNVGREGRHLGGTAQVRLRQRLALPTVRDGNTSFACDRADIRNTVLPRDIRANDAGFDQPCGLQHAHALQRMLVRHPEGKVHVFDRKQVVHGHAAILCELNCPRTPLATLRGLSPGESNKFSPEVHECAVTVVQEQRGE